MWDEKKLSKSPLTTVVDDRGNILIPYPQGHFLVIILFVPDVRRSIFCNVV